MRSLRILCGLAAAMTLVGCESRLVVQPYTTKPVRDNMIPVYLPEHEFLVTELGATADGLPADIKDYQISLITKPDRDRAFLVANNPALFSAAEFSVSLGEQGTLQKVTGKSDEQASRFITTLASLAVSAIPLTLTDYPGKDRVEAVNAEKQGYEKEIGNYRKAKKRLLEKLKEEKSAEKIKVIQEALALADKRISELEAALAAASAKIKGTMATRTRKAEVVKLKNSDVLDNWDKDNLNDWDEFKKKLSSEAGITLPERPGLGIPKFFVFLIPVDGGDANE